jgi:hypothetical protein
VADTWGAPREVAEADISETRRDLDEIAACIDEATLALTGVDRDEAASRIQRNLAGPPTTTADLRRVAALFGLSVAQDAA